LATLLSLWDAKIRPDPKKFPLKIELKYAKISGTALIVMDTTIRYIHFRPGWANGARTKKKLALELAE
jgi:hypothetical protein